MTVTSRYQFSLKSNQVEIFAIWRPFWKKMVARNKILMVPPCSPHQYTPRYQFSLKSDKVEFFAIWQPFWKKNGGSEQNFDGSIMFATSIYPKISIFIEIGQSWIFCDMAAILKKKWWLGTKFRWFHHVRHINIPQDINFHWNRTKLKFLRYGGHFEKKMVARNKILLVPSRSPCQITQRYQFSLKSDKVYIFAKWQPFWKKNGGSVNNFNSTITFATQNTTCSSWN